MGVDVVAPRTTRDGDDDESAPLVKDKSCKTAVVSVTRRHSWTVVVAALAAAAVATTTLMVFPTP